VQAAAGRPRHHALSALHKALKICYLRPLHVHEIYVQGRPLPGTDARALPAAKQAGAQSPPAIRPASPA